MASLITPTYAQESITVTHYGHPNTFNGNSLGCAGWGRYYDWDNTILAVPPSRSPQIPCGTLVEITGPAGHIVVIRQDTCPGCRHSMFDLSDAASAQVCGLPLHTCQATMRVLD